MTEQMKFKKATYHLHTFLVSKMIGSLGSNVYSFGISMYILSLTGSAFSFATNMILSFLPRILISPIAGILSDRIPRKWLVLGGQAGVILSVSGLLTNYFSHILFINFNAKNNCAIFFSAFSNFNFFLVFN